MRFDAAAAGEHHHAGHGIVHELSVMAHHQNGAFKGNQNVFQQLQRFNIQVIGGFIQHEDVSGLAEQLGENCSVLLPTAEGSRRRAYPVGREQEVIEVGDGVLSLAVDFDEVLPATNVINQVLLWVEVFPELIEIGDFQFRAQLDAALTGREIAQYQFKQGRFTGAIDSNQPDPVTAHHSRRQVFDDFLGIKAV